MKKITVLLLILLCTSLSWSQKIDDVFKAMPFEIVPGLTSEDKEMIVVDKVEVSVPNQLGEIKKIEHTDTFVKLQTSKVGTTQIKLLSAEGSSDLVCVIKSICDDACDSNVRFFTTEWKELDKESLLPKVDINYFINVEGIKNSIETDIALPLYIPLQAVLNKDDNNLTIKIDIDKLFTTSQIDKMKPYILNEELSLSWNGTSFN